MQKMIEKGNRAVVINQNPDGGKFLANLYVNTRNGLQSADITMQRWSGKTLHGAEKWAEKILNQ